MDNRIPPAQLVLWILVWTGVVLYSWLSWTGPWRWATEIWLGWFDAVDPRASFLLAWMLPFLIGAAALQLVHHRLGSPVQSTGEGLVERLEAEKGRLIVGMFVLMGLVSIARGLVAGPAVPLQLGEVHLAPLHVEIPLDRLAWEQAVEVEDDVLVPWIEGDEVVATFWVDPEDAPERQQTGMRTVWGTPGAALSLWEQDGLYAPPEIPSYDAGMDPNGNLVMGGIFLVLAAFFALVFAAVRWWRER